jgi:hypothetical protein
MTRIKFPVGDWSDDGHGKVQDFYAETSHPVETVREAHFMAEGMGIKVGQICSDYESDTVDEDILHALHEHGIKYDDLPVDEGMSPEDVFTLWIRILNATFPSMDLTPVENNVPSITFYGYDDQKRHLQSPGYGVFYD